MAKGKRKWTRPGIPTRIEQMAEQAESQAAGSAYVVYAILDPTQADPLGQFRYLPFYVGVSRQIRTRVRRHFRKAACNAFGRNLLCGRLRSLLLQNVVAEFQVIERLDNKCDAMIAETVHAQRLLKAGYLLCNYWYFQRHILTDAEMEKVVARIRHAADMELRGWL